MEVFSYNTIEKPSEGLYKEKGSKFLSFAYPVESEVGIKDSIDRLKKEYYDARHHCYAWMLGPEKKSFRAFDDGEPNHSAGDPILGQLRSRDLTNVLVVVVRYFGGIKLGVGGLVAAYKLAAEDALQNATVIQKDVKARFQIRFDYGSTASAMKLIKEFDLTILQQDFSSEGKMDVEVTLKAQRSFLEKVELLRALGTNLTVTEN